jgi:sugar (pentulose or hexulose) kinase
MSDKYVICIDLGTMGTKVAIVSTEGKILAKTLEVSILYYPRPGWVEQKPDEL